MNRISAPPFSAPPPVFERPDAIAAHMGDSMGNPYQNRATGVPRTATLSRSNGATLSFPRFGPLRGRCVAVCVAVLNLQRGSTVALCEASVNSVALSQAYKAEMPRSPHSISCTKRAAGRRLSTWGSSIVISDGVSTMSGPSSTPLTSTPLTSTTSTIDLQVWVEETAIRYFLMGIDLDRAHYVGSVE
jgi:hypothetical protein